MVQGKTKGLQTKASSSRHATRTAAAPKKGKRYIAPKKAALIKQASMHKVGFVPSRPPSPICMLDDFNTQELSAKINKSIERQMVDAASSGKLTIMKHATSEGLVYPCDALNDPC
jgi:hypothetical protein